MGSNRTQKQIGYALLITLLAGVSVAAGTSRIAIDSGDGIAVVNPDGFGYYKLTEGSRPCWYDAEIAFVRVGRLPHNGTDIWLANGDGTNPHPVVLQGEEEGKYCHERKNVETFCEHGPVYEHLAWSPYGLAFSRFNNTYTYQICFLSGDCTQLWGYDFDFTTDGRMVYWGSTDIWITADPFSVDFTPRSLIEAEPIGLWYIMDISPDDSRLAFIHNGLSVMDIASGEHTLLVEGRLYSPSWSPDGTEIAYVLGDAIYIANAESGESRLVYSSEGGIHSIDWSPWLDSETTVTPASWGQVKRPHQTAD